MRVLFLDVDETFDRGLRKFAVVAMATAPARRSIFSYFKRKPHFEYHYWGNHEGKISGRCTESIIRLNDGNI